MKNVVRVFLAAALVVLLPVFARASSDSVDSGRARERPDLARLFAARGLSGCFVAETPRGLVRVNPARCARPFSPASTFKIVNAFTAFESGVADPAFLLHWDGVARANPAWNRDLTLDEAFRVSAVWYFVALAKLNGRENLANVMRRLDYGNASVSGSDRFWLDGSLKISADGQVRALGRLARNAAGFSPRDLALLRAVMLLRKGYEDPMDNSGAWGLYGKTGLFVPAAGSAAPPVGWFVGWVERGGRAYAFALNASPVAGGAMTDAQIAARVPLAKAMLRALGVLPNY